jgi:hypothetical protein
LKGHYCGARSGLQKVLDGRKIQRANNKSVSLEKSVKSSEDDKLIRFTLLHLFGHRMKSGHDALTENALIKASPLKGRDYLS